MWPDNRILKLFGIQVPILQAPMAGSTGSALAIAVSDAGALGALPTATLNAESIRAEIAAIRGNNRRPFNLNFFCHQLPAAGAGREAGWRKRLTAYYAEFGIDADAIPPGPGRAPFDERGAEIVEEFRPTVVSFHFGLPAAPLLERVRRSGAKVIGSATSVREARALADGGCDAVIAQGADAGGHRGMFLESDPWRQAGTMSLVPQVVDAIDVPVIAAGGITDARGIAAAFALGASAVQMGTAFLRCPEALTNKLHRAALAKAGDADTAMTNVFTGRPARSIVNRLVAEVGPLAPEVAAFPLAGAAIAPLRQKIEPAGQTDFTPLWAGQAVALGKEQPARAFIEAVAAEALALLRRPGRDA